MMDFLQTLLHKNNPFVTVFKQAHETLSQLQDTNGAELAIVIDADKAPDPRTYNLPTCNKELGAIIPIVDGLENTGNVGQRDIMLRLKAGKHKTQTISETHPWYDPLHYVLLFPLGEQGWKVNMQLTQPGTAQEHSAPDGPDGPPRKKQKLSRISLRQFYAHRLMLRQKPNLAQAFAGQEDPPPVSHLGGPLFQQYCVDMNCKLEAQKICWVNHNQDTLRSDVYQGLAEAVEKGDKASTMGKKVVLPKSFYGGPRHLHHLYHNAMARVQRYGKPR